MLKITEKNYGLINKEPFNPNDESIPEKVRVKYTYYRDKGTIKSPYESDVWNCYDERNDIYISFSNAI